MALPAATELTTEWMISNPEIELFKEILLELEDLNTRVTALETP